MSALGFSEKEDVLRYVSANNIRILNLCHVPEEGRLKSLSFSVGNAERVDEILDFGERVDGSNLFSMIQPGESDIYIVPDLKRAFVDPFSTLPSINILCDYMDKDGKPLDVAPGNVLARAEERLLSSARVSLGALAELEFYVIARGEGGVLFPASSDRNYHESAPFAKFQDIRNEVLATLDLVGVPTKYGHGEVGLIHGENGTLMEQHEVELKAQNLGRMAEAVAIAKWVVRNVCARHGVSASFIPKIDLNHAGTGMHVHMCALRDGVNVVSKADGSLSSEALQIIGGILGLAPSLAAFGNPTPVSYLRFIARKESPMHVCWSHRNRLALVRVPLWWDFKNARRSAETCRETFEYRAPDAFANAHLLLGGLAVAACHGLRNPKDALKLAEDFHAEEVGFGSEHLKALPLSCSEAAQNLEKDRSIYEADDVFPKKLIDGTLKRLRAFEDQDRWKEFSGKPGKIEKMIAEYMHCG